MTFNSTGAFKLERKGILLVPDNSLFYESGGVLNPATASHNGVSYMLYRSVALEPHNYSRIMVAELRETESGLVSHRLNVTALEPQESYEKWRDNVHGGVEDPRITPMEDGSYLMTYTAYGDGPGGDAIPRIALARSENLLEWSRLGLIAYSPLILKGRSGQTYTIDMQTISNKDALLFPVRFENRYAMIHRPTFPAEIAQDLGQLPSVWISYSDDLLHWTDHQLLFTSEAPWESLKTGGGTPPLRTKDGWLVFYHGVQGRDDADPERRYLAGAVLLELADPRKVLYRTPEPVLIPTTQAEQVGIVNHVVFPTGVLPRPDGRVRVIYGMADRAIGLAETIEPVI